MLSNSERLITSIKIWLKLKLCLKRSKYLVISVRIAKITNYKIHKLAEIDRHEEFVAADFYM